MNVIHRAAVATVIISNLSLQVALSAAAHAEERPDRELSNVRLTGVLIQPDRQLAIFAVKGVKGAETRILSVGQALNGWKLDSISPEGVSLSGPGGTRTLQPEGDTTLVRHRMSLPPSTKEKPRRARQRGSVEDPESELPASCSHERVRAGDLFPDEKSPAVVSGAPHHGRIFRDLLRDSKG